MAWSGDPLTLTLSRGERGLVISQFAGLFAERRTIHPLSPRERVRVREPALAKKVPALIQHHLNLLEPAVILRLEDATIALLQELVLLDDELIDVL
jgi:hypothetical protein